MPVALSVLLLVTTLAGAGLVAAGHASSATTHGTDRMLALAAAEAGVDVAIYRLDNVSPAPTGSQCVTTSAGAPNGAGQCSDGPESIGNGMTFSFVDTTVGDPGAYCLGQVLPAADRCVTAEGTVHGVSRPAQVLVTSSSAGGSGGTPAFVVNGIEALGGYRLDTSNAGMTIPIATNGTARFTQAYTVFGTNNCPSAGPYACNGLYLTSPNGKLWCDTSVICDVRDGDNGSNITPCGNGYGPCGPSTPTSPPLTDVALTLTQLPASIWNSVHATNIDTTGISGGTITNNEWSGSGGLTIQPGNYYFCKFSLGTSSSLNLPSSPSGPVNIYIDSPTDTTGPGSTACPSVSSDSTVGSFNVSSSTYFNSSQNASMFNVYVYGQQASTTCDSSGSSTGCDINLGNNDSTATHAAFYAPQSGLYLGVSAKYVGGAAVAYFHQNNSSSWSFDSSLSTATVPGTSTSGPTTFSRAGWHECQDTSTWPPAAGWAC